MVRTFVLASAALVGLAVGAASEARAYVGVRVRVGGVSVGYRDVGHRHGPVHVHPRPVVVHRPVVVTRPVIVAPVEPVYVAPVIRHYHVLYRACIHDPWVTYGTFASHGEAHFAERQLERSGYLARVVHHD
jgi:hypothetical protein